MKGTTKDKARRTGAYLKQLLRLERLSREQSTVGFRMYGVNGGPSMNLKELIARIDFNKKRLKELLSGSH